MTLCLIPEVLVNIVTGKFPKCRIADFHLILLYWLHFHHRARRKVSIRLFWHASRLDSSISLVKCAFVPFLLRDISSYIILPTSERLCQSFESKPANLSRKLVESTCDGSNTNIFSALGHRTVVHWKLSDNWSKISNNVCLFKEMRRGVNAMEGNFTYYVLRFCLPRSWVQLPDINTQFSI